jgi:patatin-like phospholipase/acyl hydrolase
MNTRRILTIDGGGIKGVFPASFLATIEDSIGDSVAEYFDLIVGTSTGGIIALGLGLGLSAKDILDFYEKLGPSIFPGNYIIKLLRWIGFSKYDQRPLKSALISTFGEIKLGESSTRLVVLISVNYKFPSTTIIFPVASPMMLPRNQPKAGE